MNNITNNTDSAKVDPRLEEIRAERRAAAQERIAATLPLLNGALENARAAIAEYNLVRDDQPVGPEVNDDQKKNWRVKFLHSTATRFQAKETYRNLTTTLLSSYVALGDMDSYRRIMAQRL